MSEEANPSLVISQDTKGVYDDLYDSLFVQSLLQHADSSPLSFKERRKLDIPNEAKAPWPQFLDRLAFLCDSHRGGRSVVALGAEETANDVILWLAGSPVHQDAQVTHLAKVIALLVRSVSSNEHERISIVESITAESIARSKKKIYNYGKRLYNLYKHQRKIDPLNQDQTKLLDDLEQLLTTREVNSELCQAAYAFRTSGYSEMLEGDERMSHDRWLCMRHFIGRLGYWRRAAKWLVSNAPVFAQILRRLRVDKIPYPGSCSRPQPKLNESLEQLVLRLFPNYRGTPLCSALVEKLSQSKELLSWFHGHVLNSRPHAELILLDYFYSHGLKWAGDVRYIGCSKHSCYCCSLYIRLHPGGICSRPSHGNIWVQWCLPQPLHRGTTGVDEKNVGIVRRMADESRESTINALTKVGPQPRQRFESTTGFSTSVKSLVAVTA